MPNDGDIRADPNPQWPMAYTYESRPCVITSGICDQEAIGVQEAVVEAENWLRAISTWLLETDNDMKLPDGVLDADPLDIADRLGGWKRHDGQTTPPPDWNGGSIRLFTGGIIKKPGLPPRWSRVEAYIPGDMA